ncbi:hypothetical protein SRABI96_02450 [Peribacillus sp. Bi96]|uniref:hypothetical protein n=1 Tax=Peribacillus sp. Bi96 TaxID=2884273 RepID=UPI001E17F8C5|nr:hypothetical protein [Peribacillus sp. Bi96]CAH0222649.1 hypothetical protein SRABI96_02450 [Peribacillus sp. Bi96]
MDKQEMIKGMEVKVNEVIGASQAVSEFVESIEETVTEGVEAVKQLEAVIETKTEALNTFTDMGEARLAKQEINNLVEELELQKAVNTGKEKAMKSELEEVIVTFFAVHKGACMMFRGLDNHLVANTSLSELNETKATMEGFGNSLTFSFAGVKQILLDTKIVAQADQNRQYRGIHLGQRGQETQLYGFEYVVRAYVQQLRASDIAI